MPDKIRKGRRGSGRKKLVRQKELTTSEVHKAMREAGNAIDELGSQVNALRRIVVAERAQVIYYTDQALAFSERKTLDIKLRGFHELSEDDQEKYVKRAIAELASDQAIVPHTADGAAPAKKPKLEIVH